MTGPLATVLAIVRAMRPAQWTKNLFVFAPLLFDQHFDQVGRNVRILAAFGIFCCLASGVYLLNDVLDRQADRLHPKKRFRPVASGALPVPLAVAVGVLLIGGGLAWAVLGLGDRWLPKVCVAYVVIQFAYSIWLKHAVILDVLCIASGFVLRILAGAAAIWLIPSTWIVVCAIFVSLFLALCKRRQEVTSLGADAAAHREILAHYPERLLDQLIGAAVSGTLVTYALYTVDDRTIRAHNLFHEGEPLPVLAATIPFVIYGVFRYLYLVYRRDEGGSPTSTLLRDVPSLVNGVLYLATVVAILAQFR